MPGFDNGTMYANNVDFTGNTAVAATVTTNGQLLVGSTATPNIKVGTITSPNSTLTIGYSSPNITLDVSSSFSFIWTDVTSATQNLAVKNGYLTDRGAGVTYTLPAFANIGDEIKIVGKLGLTTVAQNANQAIRMGSSISTTGITGSIAGTNVGDCVTLVCTTAGTSTIWIAEAFVGNWTVT